MQYNRDFKTVTNSNTIAQWVDAYNNNALAGSDIAFMIGEATFSSVLYTGLETVGNGVNSYKMESFKDVAPNFKAVFPDNLVLDNWYCYFRNINKFILVSQLHVDLTDYSKYDNNEFVQGDLYHFFLNYELGYRISHSPIPKEGEARLFRFIARDSYFTQLIPTFPRYFYSGDNTDYVKVTGMDVKAVTASGISTKTGLVDYDGISFDFHPVPDRKYYNEVLAPGFTINNMGMGYCVGDVIGTNDYSQNFLITDVKNEADESNIWNAVTDYTEGEMVCWNYYWWTCQSDNKNQEPALTSPYWLRGEVAGSIIDGELTTDPIQTKLGGKDGKVEVGDVSTPWPILYNTEENKLDYTLVSKTVDGSKIMDYTNNTLTDLDANKFTIQRIHLDYLKDILVIQYGNQEFESMKDALDAVYSLSFPFVYNTYIFPVLAYMIVRSDYTSLLDPDQCQIIQIHTSSTDIRESEYLATDSYARSLIDKQQKQIEALNMWLTNLQADHDKLKSDFDLHISNNLPTPDSILKGTNPNPHRVTKTQVGLGNVDNVAMKDMWVPSSAEVLSGNADGLVHVREALDELERACKGYTDSSNSGTRTWCESQFLFKVKDDYTRSGVTTTFTNLQTNSDHMKFKSSYNSKANEGVAWYVGNLPATECPAYGVMKSS